MGRRGAGPAGAGPDAVAPGTQVLGDLGLPADEELIELMELGAESLTAAGLHDSPDLLADYLDFARRRLAALHAGPVTDEQVRSLPRLLAGDGLATEAVLAGDLVDRALARLPDVPPRDGPVLGTLARAYLERVLAGDRDAAIALVVDGADAGTDVAVLLTEVLEPAQHEIGRRWEDGGVTIAQEHFCTAVTQLALAALHTYLFDGRRPAAGRRRLVAVQAGGGQHQVGLRMVVDLLEHDGWDTTYLGTQGDPRHVIAALVDRQAAVLAISASMPADVAHVEALVRAVRADPRTSSVRVIVGGRPFLVAPDLAAKVGADGHARDAREAVTLCAAQGADVAV